MFWNFAISLGRDSLWRSVKYGELFMSLVSYIEYLRNGLEELLKSDLDVQLFGEDIAEPYGGAFKVTKGLSLEFPDRVIQTPMSEQGFTGMAVGMALAGMKPIVEIMFGDFSTLIADQIINHASKFVWLYKKPMNMVIRAPMGGYRGYGATHSQSLERLFFGQPHTLVIAPSVLNNPGRLLINSVYEGVPVIFVENKLDYARRFIEHTENYQDLEINTLGIFFPTTEVKIAGFDESELTIITYGGLTQLALELQWKFMLEEEIPIKLLCPSKISPIDEKALLEFTKNDKKILILEEGYKKFGWGSEVSRILYQAEPSRRIRHIGAKSEFIGASQILEDCVLPNTDNIDAVMREMVGSL